MFNSEKPSLDELPGTAQLIRSTVLAAVVALLILLTVVLPAEYGFDPTGAGRVLGLTEMGVIKQQLSQEAKEDDHHDDQQSFWLDVLDALIPVAKAEESWRDEISFTLAPGEATEIKLVMENGNAAQYTWVAEGGRINFDLHAHGNGESVTYEKGRGKSSGEGGFTASFAGNHGWFWRNRDKQDVTVVIKISGDYGGIVRE